MPSQSRIKAVSWTTLVLLIVCLSSISGLAQTSTATSPTPATSSSRSGDRQVDQGRQYGQPGFVGEPINLNVVNADIRDILN